MSEKTGHFRRTAVMLVCIFAIAALSGCGENKGIKDSKESTEEVFAMDTYMSVTAYGEKSKEATAEAISRIQELDHMLSASSHEDSPDSESDETAESVESTKTAEATKAAETTEATVVHEIYQLNENGSGKLSKDVDNLMGRAIELNKLTDGAFNPCMYAVMESWGFTTKNYRVPEDSELEKLKELTDISQLEYDSGNKTLKINKEGMKMDLGGIAKGYTSSQIIEIFKSYGIESGLLNLGGNVQALGTKPDGTSWRVGIQAPSGSSEYMGVIAVKDKAVITSGGYERYFEKDGKTYHHIIDPETCMPAENDLESVTIVSEDGTLADALSTALFVMGKEKAQEFWKEYGDEYGFEILLADSSGNVYVSAGISDDFECEESYRTVVIKKK